MENLPDRLAAQKALAARFTKDTGVKVELVAVAEDQFNQMLTSAAAAGDLPDVIGALPLAARPDPVVEQAARHRRGRQVVDDLGAGTFTPARSS